jgi:hypothetical protein
MRGRLPAHVCRKTGICNGGGELLGGISFADSRKGSDVQSSSAGREASCEEGYGDANEGEDTEADDDQDG